MNNLLVHARRLAVVAAVLVVVALYQAMLAFAAIGETRASLRERLDVLDHLRTLNAGPVAMRATVDDAAAQLDEQSRLEKLIGHHLAGIEFVREPPETVPLHGNVKLIRHALRIDEITPLRLGQFLVDCENARPPVRLAGIQITSPRGETARAAQARITLLELTR